MVKFCTFAFSVMAMAAAVLLGATPSHAATPINPGAPIILRNDTNKTFQEATVEQVGFVYSTQGGTVYNVPSNGQASVGVVQVMDAAILLDYWNVSVKYDGKTYSARGIGCNIQRSRLLTDVSPIIVKVYIKDPLIGSAGPYVEISVPQGSMFNFAGCSAWLK